MLRKMICAEPYSAFWISCRLVTPWIQQTTDKRFLTLVASLLMRIYCHNSLMISVTSEDVNPLALWNLLHFAEHQTELVSGKYICANAVNAAGAANILYKAMNH